jgi:predicted 2-oxoglutarate/Fe(II)-dependent dioxygenase YbiX
LSPGDLAPDWGLKTLGGGSFAFRSDGVAGHTLVIFVAGSSAEGEERVEQFRQKATAIAALGALVYFVFPSMAAAKRWSWEPAQALVDEEGKVAASLKASSSEQATVIVLRANHHVAALFRADEGSEAIQALCKRLESERVTVVAGSHPPVLLVPEVFSKEECRQLIDVFETRGQVLVKADKAIDYFGADYKMQVPEHMREDRVDHFFYDKSTIAFLLHRLGRVELEVARAFHYRITKHETLRIARYEGSRQGYLHGHRDNIPPHEHRRFALSINLNTDEFAGGEVRFPEFGDQRYRPPSGTAFVFSSSLLHEALEVTAGRRFVFLSFMYGDS